MASDESKNNSMQNNSNYDNNNNCGDSSYNLRIPSFEDSQVDHFVPYSSPSILYWHNNKNRLNDITLFTLAANKNVDANMSEDVERMRGNSYEEMLSGSNLIQIPAENTLNSTNETLERKDLKDKRNVSYENVEAQESKLNDLIVDNNSIDTDKQFQIENEPTNMEKIEKLPINSNLNLSKSGLAKSSLNEFSNSLTRTESDIDQKAKSKSTITEETLANQQTHSNEFNRLSSKRLQSVLNSKNQLNTPSGNVLGGSNKFKVNLFSSDESFVDSKITTRKLSNSSDDIELVSSQFTTQKTNDMATSPIQFVSLSPNSFTIMSISNNTKLVPMDATPPENDKSSTRKSDFTTVEAISQRSEKESFSNMLFANPNKSPSTAPSNFQEVTSGISKSTLRTEKSLEWDDTHLDCVDTTKPQQQQQQQQSSQIISSQSCERVKVGQLDSNLVFNSEKIFKNIETTAGSNFKDKKMESITNNNNNNNNNRNSIESTKNFTPRETTKLSEKIYNSLLNKSLSASNNSSNLNKSIIHQPQQQQQDQQQQHQEHHQEQQQKQEQRNEKDEEKLAKIKHVNILKEELIKKLEDSDNEIELDEEFLKLMDKKLKKLIRKSFEKSKAMSTINNSSLAKSNKDSPQNESLEISRKLEEKNDVVKSPSTKSKKPPTVAAAAAAVMSETKINKIQQSSNVLQEQNYRTQSSENFTQSNKLDDRFRKLSLKSNSSNTESDSYQYQLKEFKNLIENPVRALIENNQFVNKQSKLKHESNNKRTSLDSSNFLMANHQQQQQQHQQHQQHQQRQHERQNSNKENNLTEAATQTSFLLMEQHQQNSRSNKFGNDTSNGDYGKRYSLGYSNLMNSQKRMNKEKIHELINFQKQQHEQRLQALEKLAKLERLQAEKLKNLMMTSNDSILCDSYFQTNKTYLNDDGSIDIEKLERDLNEEELNSYGQSRETISDNRMMMTMTMPSGPIDKYPTSSKLSSTQIIERRKSEFLSANNEHLRPNTKPDLYSSDDSTFQDSFNLNGYPTPRTQSSKVEVVNLKDTSVYEQPKNVLVVKEKPGKKVTIIESSNQQTNNNLRIDQNGRLVYAQCAPTNDMKRGAESILKSNIGSSCSPPISNSTSTYRSIKFNITDSNNKRVYSQKPISWFAPIAAANLSDNQNTSNDSHDDDDDDDDGQKIIKYSNSEPIFRKVESQKNNLIKNEYRANSQDMNCLSRAMLHNKRSYHRLDNHNNNNSCSLQNMSLQEAFETFKKDLINRSHMRQKEIQKRAEQRHQEEELKRKLNEMNRKDESEMKKDARRKSLMIRNNQDFIMASGGSGTSGSGNSRRRMSLQEIKNQNKKFYEKLPEVKQKQLRQHLEEIKRLNRMKSSIYKKSIQQHVLSHGPNFNLNFKAIEDFA